MTLVVFWPTDAVLAYGSRLRRSAEELVDAAADVGGWRAGLGTSTAGTRAEEVGLGAALVGFVDTAERQLTGRAALVRDLGQVVRDTTIMVQNEDDRGAERLRRWMEDLERRAARLEP